MATDEDFARLVSIVAELTTEVHKGLADCALLADHVSQGHQTATTLADSARAVEELRLSAFGLRSKVTKG